MELHPVSEEEAVGVLPDMEAGVEPTPFVWLHAFEEFKVQDADADAFLEHAVAVARLDLASEHLREVEQGAFRPYPQFRELDLDIDLLVVAHQEAYVEDAKLVVGMFLPEAGVKDIGFFDILRPDFEDGRQEASACLRIHHDLLEGEINLGFHKEPCHNWFISFIIFYSHAV